MPIPAGHGGAAGQLFSPEQLYALARKVGFSQSSAVTAGSIAMAESGGESDATSPNPDGGTNVGLWQLDTNGVGSGHSVDELKDPWTNAQITFQGSKHGTDWGPWATFGSGAYLAHTTAVEKGRTAEQSGTPLDSILGALAGILPGGAGGLSGLGIPNPLSGIAQVGAVLEAFFRAITDVTFWRSLGWITLGVIVMGLGVIWVFRKQIEEGAGTVAGAAAKAV